MRRCGQHSGYLARGLLAIAATLLPVVALAGTFSPPKGCTGYMTVQMRSCLVANYYRCDFDNPGDQHYVEFGEEGLTSFGKVDAEYQWLETWNFALEEVEFLQTPALDPASFSGLLATGADAYDFTMESESGVLIRYTGQDTLRGRTVEIDGVTLEETDFDMLETYVGVEEAWRGRGQDYIHRDWRIFLAGKGAWSSGAESVDYDYTPVTFAFPGEDGFFTTDPQYDCGATMASAPLWEALR